MKLAITPPLAGTSATEAVRLTALAERLGYEEAWLAEVGGPESFAMAAAVAAATERMPIGVAVVPATTRTPALLAMGAGTISQLAGGRPFALGIGSSSEVIVSQWHGLPFDRPLRRVRETVLATRAALGGERDFSGETVTMRRFPLASPPAGPVPIYVGALGPGMLRLAGEVGDGVCLNLMPARMVPAQLAEVQRGVLRGGRDVEFGVMARLDTVVSDDVAAARALIRRAFGPYFAQPVYNRFLAWCGYPEEAAEVAAAFAAGDRERLAVAFHDDLVDELTLVGPAGWIRERLDEYAAAGVTIAALHFVAPGPEEAEQAIRALAPGG